jgi:putative PIG3 family NAD(P)H quinone oxidoreductase
VRAWVIESGHLVLREVPLPVPGPGCVRVRVRAVGVNRADLLQVRGAYPAPPDVPADIPGMEFAGEVDELGEGVEWPPAGDWVMGIVGGGAYAEHLVVPAEHVVPVPRGTAFAQAAALPEAFVTAHDALERLGVTAGEWVLVHAVGSGVGLAALQLVKLRGARCIGTSRTRGKLERSAAFGLDAGVNTEEEPLVAAVRAVSGEGAHAAVDLVGGALFPRTLEALRRCGRLVLVGLTAGRRAEVDLGLVLNRRLRIEGTVLRSRSRAEKAMAVAAFREAVLPALADGRVRPVVDRVLPFDQVPDALGVVERNQNFGKVVIELG